MADNRNNDLVIPNDARNNDNRNNDNRNNDNRNSSNNDRRNKKNKKGGKKPRQSCCAIWHLRKGKESSKTS